ncbi:MAG: carbon-nitrogen hydrolase family protein [Chloroflexota bacterium]
MNINVTICQLRDDPGGLEQDWRGLVNHAAQQSSHFVLLPEMPFAPWVALETNLSARRWQEFVAAHDRWMERLNELSPAMVAGSRPVIHNGRRLNEAFIWDNENGYRAVHYKTFLPDEPGFWEATWYDRGPVEFTPTGTPLGKIGFLVCTEIWFTEYARSFARQGARLLLSPRTTEKSTADKWVMGGRVAAIMSGAYCLSSNRSGPSGAGFDWGGKGWIAEPDQGNLLGVTSEDEPYLTVSIDLTRADAAKSSYPRYVKE